MGYQAQNDREHAGTTPCHKSHPHQCRKHLNPTRTGYICLGIHQCSTEIRGWLYWCSIRGKVHDCVFCEAFAGPSKLYPQSPRTPHSQQTSGKKCAVFLIKSTAQLHIKSSWERPPSSVQGIGATSGMEWSWMIPRTSFKRRWWRWESKEATVMEVITVTDLWRKMMDLHLLHPRRRGCLTCCRTEEPKLLPRLSIKESAGWVWTDTVPSGRGSLDGSSDVLAWQLSKVPFDGQVSKKVQKVLLLRERWVWPATLWHQWEVALSQIRSTCVPYPVRQEHDWLWLWITIVHCLFWLLVTVVFRNFFLYFSNSNR